MKRLKTVALVVGMAMALIAVLGAASASATQFRAGQYPTTVSGSLQSLTQKITTGGTGFVTCDTATASGVMSAASSTMTLIPTLAKCKYVGTSVSAKVNGCTYVLHSTNEAAPYAGTFDVSCPSGSKLEFVSNITKCTVQVPAQSALAAVEFANTGTSGSGRTITMTLNVSGLKSTEVGTECANPNGTNNVNGTLTSTTLLKGSDGSYAVGVYLGSEQSGGTPLHSFEGEEYPLTVEASQEVVASKVTVPLWSSTSCGVMGGVSVFNLAGGTLNQGIQSWSKCSASVGTISMNGCYFVLNQASSEVAAATVGIACSEAGASITFLAAGSCEIKIPAQSAGSSFSVENKGTGSSRYMTVTWWMSGLKYVEGCTGGKSLEGASMTGTWNVKGYQYKGIGAGGLPLAGAQKGIWST